MLIKENFTGLLVQLTNMPSSSNKIIEFLNKILTSEEPDLSKLMVNITDLISISKILVNHFFALERTIDGKIYLFYFSMNLKNYFLS